MKYSQVSTTENYPHDHFSVIFMEALTPYYVNAE